MKEIISFAAGAFVAGGLMWVYGDKVKADTIAEVGKLKEELIAEFGKAVAAIKKAV